MRYILGCLGSAIVLSAATPAFAQDEEPASPVTINGSVTLVSDYRFRGVSQTDKGAAIQGSITVGHESGFYASVWGSSVSSSVIAGPNATAELDLILGWKKTFGGTTVDVGLLYYYYPRSRPAADFTMSNFAEPYLAVTQAIGPVTAKGTIAWAPSQKGLRLDQSTGPNRSNVYLAADLSASIPNTPIGLTAHLGHSIGPSWLANDAFGKTKYTDWSLGATVTHKALTLGVSYVDTDARFVNPTGRIVSNGGIVVSVGASF